MPNLPTSLTYYTNLQTGLKVMKYKAFPLLRSSEMNDPFMPADDTELSFDCQELFEQSVRYMTSAILGKMPPKGNPNHSLQKAVRRWRGEDRFTDEEEIRQALVGLLPAMVEQAHNHAKDIHSQWQIYSKEKRVVPLYTNAKDFNLWHIEAGRHSGMAIRFKCDDDSIFEHCRPVQYSKRPAKSVNIRDCVDVMVGETQKLEFDFEGLLLAQNYEFRNQKEWRMITDIGGYKDSQIEFPVELIQSVYLGAAIPLEKVERLVHIAKQLNSSVSVYRAKCQSSSYELDFERC